MGAAGDRLLGTALLTQLVYPLLYGGILTPALVPVTVLTVRNLALIALLVWMVVRLAAIVRSPVRDAAALRAASFA